jgi:hypothetical protein
MEMPVERWQCGSNGFRKRAGSHEYCFSGNATAVMWLMFIAFSVVMRIAVAQGTMFSFLQFSNYDSGLTLLGDASIGQEDLALQLTQNNSGRALYRTPILFTDASSHASISFQTSFVFSVDSSTDPSSMGEGLTFLIVPDNTTLGSSGPWLGLFNPINGSSTATPNPLAQTVAVEFDIHKDIEFWDINDNHVGIDINSLDSIFAKEASSDMQVVNLTSGHIKAWIEYDGQARKMSVSITPFVATNDYPKPAQPLLVVDVDLSSYVSEYMFVGFSAATGSGVVNHKVYSWSFESTDSSLSDFEDISPTPSPSGPAQPVSQASLFRAHDCGRLLALLLVLVLSCLAF